MNGNDPNQQNGLGYDCFKRTGIVRSLDGLGRITIPSELRSTTGINCGDPMEIFIKDGHIILQRFHISCMICGEFEDTKKIGEKSFCLKCINKIKNMK